MIAKLVVWAPTRAQAIARLRRAIDEYTIGGVTTTLPLLRALCDDPAVESGSYTTSTLEAVARQLPSEPKSSAMPTAHSAAHAAADRTIRVEVDDKLYRVRLFDLPSRSAADDTVASIAPRRRSAKTAAGTAAGNEIASPMHGVIVAIEAAVGQKVAQGDVVAVVEAMKMMNELRAHRSGTVIKVHGAPGDSIESGAPVVTLG
jgi:acetyl-CoA/propionyl-CoA carboxylase biotin carboxyl carrier protein